MGRKYIVEIIGDGAGSMGYPTIEPYTEPDLECVKKTAHDDGYSEGYQAGRGDLNRVMSDVEQINKEKDEIYDKARARGYDEGRARGYQEGLFDTWEAAKRIENLSEAEKFEIFGEYDMFHIMRRYTPAEAIEKLKAYEQKQKEIKVGDVVRLKSAPEVEIWVIYISEEYDGILSGVVLKAAGANCDVGDAYINRDICMFERTGKHFDVADVAATLEKMREGQE